MIVMLVYSCFTLYFVQNAVFPAVVMEQEEKRVKLVSWDLLTSKPGLTGYLWLFPHTACTLDETHPHSFLCRTEVRLWSMARCCSLVPDDHPANPPSLTSCPGWPFSPPSTADGEYSETGHVTITMYLNSWHLFSSYELGGIWAQD